MIAVRYLGRYRAGRFVREDPVYRLLCGPGARQDVGRRIGRVRRYGGYAQRREAVDIARLVHHTHRMHGIIQIAHENGRIIFTDQPLHGFDGAARLLDPGGLPGVALNGMTLMRVMRGAYK